MPDNKNGRTLTDEEMATLKKSARENPQYGYFVVFDTTDGMDFQGARGYTDAMDFRDILSDVDNLQIVNTLQFWGD